MNHEDPGSTQPRSTQQTRTFRGTIAGGLLAVITVIGCSATLPLSEVQGVVLLDGQPVPNAIIEFQPSQRTERSRPSIGETDAAGKFRLRFSKDRWGAVPGTHKVLITTYSPSGSGKFRERIPPSYNSNTTLVRTVEPKSNWMDFHLQSDVALGPELTATE